MWDDGKRERRGFPPSFSHCCLYASLSPLLGLLETQRDNCEGEKNAKLQVNALRKQSLEWVYFYSRTSWKRPPNGCGRLREVITNENIGQQKVSFENRPCTFWKKIPCMQFISLDMLWRSSYPLSSEVDTVYRNQTIFQVVAFRRLKQRRTCIELLSKVLMVAYERCCLQEILIIESFDGKIIAYGRWSLTWGGRT